MNVHSRKLRALSVTAAVAVGAALMSGFTSGPAQAAPACTGSTFTSDCDYVVPAGVASLAVTVTGAAGGSWTANSNWPDPGGKGAVVSARLTVTPGELIQVRVGGQGGSVAADEDSGGAPGENGGGAGGDGLYLFSSVPTGGGGAGGGGYSALLAGATPLVVAGGGGGASDRSDDQSWIPTGGDAGLPSGAGADGACCANDDYAGNFGTGALAAPGAVGLGGVLPVDPGTATPGGDGTSMFDGGTGKGGDGGDGNSTTGSGGGGGGGGGYNGGGGGSGNHGAWGGAGGGGSSYVNPAYGTGTFATAAALGDGSVTIEAGPGISGISPTSGPTAGGTAVTIAGSGFATTSPPTTIVTIGGQPCTSLHVLSSTSLTCTTGAHASGTADIVVTNTDADSTTMTGLLADGFTYEDPHETKQLPLRNCVTPPSKRGIPLRGTARLMKPNCLTNADQPVKVRATGGAAASSVSARGDRRLFRIVKRKNGTFIRTFGNKVRVKITWSAPATDTFSAYAKVKQYRN